jgi:hypothetical protein
MKVRKTKDLICPFCDEGGLMLRKCGKCRKEFLICDECESIYKDEESLKGDTSYTGCPKCGASVD